MIKIDAKAKTVTIKQRVSFKVVQKLLDKGWIVIFPKH